MLVLLLRLCAHYDYYDYYDYDDDYEADDADGDDDYDSYWSSSSFDETLGLSAVFDQVSDFDLLG